jgi:hypothetical protein
MALGALALLAPAALAKGKNPRAKFKLTASGSQTTTFTEDSPPIETFPGCHGSGEEDITFATAQPLKVKVRLVEGPGGFKRPTFTFPKQVRKTLPVDAVIHRTQNWTQSPACPAKTCEGGPAPVGWRLLLLGAHDAKNTVAIEDDDDPQNPSGSDPIRATCPPPPAGGTYFPTLLSRNAGVGVGADPEGTGDLLVKGALSNKALFKKKKKELTSDGQGNQRVDFSGETWGGSGTANTSTSWTLDLKRIK